MRRCATQVPSIAACLGKGAAPAADAALLPPGSLGPRGTPVAAAELPSLEAFWRDYMSTDTPVVISGELWVGGWVGVWVGCNRLQGPLWPLSS